MPIHHLGVASRSSLSALVGVAALLAAVATASAGAVRPRPVRALSIVRAATPHFPVRDYLTLGHYPKVRGVPGLATTNATLRRAIIADQQRYAPSARRYAGGPFHGIYGTAIDHQLTSASTVVVSALMPARKYYPGGNDGETWISATVDVRSGRLVSLRELLAHPRLALPVLARDWKARIRRLRLFWPAVAEDPASYTPTFAHYRYFALTRTGLAFGFPQEPAGPRIAAVIPYRQVDSYLSPLGSRLVAGVRRPLPDR
jgi:hypothetical protein